MRYINGIFTAVPERSWDNQELLSIYEPRLEQLDLDEESRRRLREFVRFQLVGERSRGSAVPNWDRLEGFADRASAFESASEALLERLAAGVLPAAEAAGVRFDAVLTTTATGNLMPGLSYRIARRLGDRVPDDALMIDLGNVGCTGSLKALNLACSLEASMRNILVVAVEVPTTLVDTRGTAFDLWQGNCTFGDGAAAVWISDDAEQGDSALALEELRYRQVSIEGLDLIRWGYRSYYAFALRDEKTFDRDVRQYVTDALNACAPGWRDEPRWAIHPAGITLLVRISRKLGIPSEAIQPSVAHYRRQSNMSSASILHILAEVAGDAPEGAGINLLSMGAGFNVIYGRARRVR